MSTVSQYEKELLEAGERLGELMGRTTGTNKELLRSLHDQVESVARQKQSEGILVDKAALFACVIITSIEIDDDELVRAAGDYIDKDYMFCKSLREQKS
ncbi:MAG: hypothetical protein AB1758_03620 [Candidatus Eremiobacterota bacterium]